MEKRNQSPESGANGSPLDMLELVALLGSVVGSGVSIATGGIVYAASPITLALLLNFANRRRIDQLSLQNSRTARGQVQQVSEQLQSLQQRLSSAPVGSQGGEQVDLQPLQANMGFLQHQYDGLQSTLNNVTEHLQSLPGVGAIAGLEGALADLSARLTSVEQAPVGAGAAPVDSADLGQIRANLESLEARLADVSASPAAASSESGVDRGALDSFKTEVHSQYAGLQSALSEVAERLHGLPGADAIAGLEGMLSSLSSRLTSLEQAPAPEGGAPTGETADLGQLRADLETMVTPVRQQVETLEARLSHLSEAPAPSVEPAALEGLQTQVHQLNSQMESALTEIAQRVANVPVTVQSIVQEHLQHQPATDNSASVEALKQQVELLEKRLEEVASQASSSHTTDEDDLDLDALLSGLE
jgi:chromosome segregation ATPase